MASQKPVDPAQKLADEFKKQGHFDKLKQEMLLSHVSDSESTTLQDFIKNRVTAVVQNMVNEDESLIFKNRGSTSALIEGQLLKDGYQKLGTDSVKLEDLVKSIFDQPALQKQLREKLMDDLTCDGEIDMINQS